MLDVGAYWIGRLFSTTAEKERGTGCSSSTSLSRRGTAPPAVWGTSNSKLAWNRFGSAARGGHSLSDGAHVVRDKQLQT